MSSLLKKMFSTTFVKEWWNITIFIIVVFISAFVLKQYNTNQYTVYNKSVAQSRVISNSTFEEQQKPVPKKIENIRIGDRVAGINPEYSTEYRKNAKDPDQASWYLLKMQMVKSDGKSLYVELLRPQVWIEEEKSKVNGKIFLTLSELGAFGLADILAIEPSPPIHPGNGNVVTGRFIHEQADIIDLYIEGVIAPIGCTPNHPFWSVERNQFIEAEQLQPNERLKISNGDTVRFLRSIPRKEQETVYNIEVHNEHVYEITSSGILVHNAYHHAIPKFLGGHVSQDLVSIPTVIHQKYHSLLTDALNAKGIPKAVREFNKDPITGALGHGSTSEYIKYFSSHPNEQLHAFSAIVEAGENLSKTHPDEARAILDTFLKNLEKTTAVFDDYL